MLTRDLDDTTANMGGVSLSSVTNLSTTYLDLHGYGPVVQGVLGAAAYCTFRGETGGTWPDGLWPPLNATNNTIFGTVVNNRPTPATALLNYGPSWQYNPVSGNTLPGGSVSFIANNTGALTSFPDLFASYIRNQWALMAYSIAPLSGAQKRQQFVGTSSQSKLFIRVTPIAIVPVTALVIGLFITLRAWLVTIRLRYWVDRVEFGSWWLVKALRPDLYDAGYCNASSKDFQKACGDYELRYTDMIPDEEIGHLMLVPIRDGDVPSAIHSRRVYGKR
jgi:hypothetical protein